MAEKYKCAGCKKEFDEEKMCCFAQPDWYEEHPDIPENEYWGWCKDCCDIPVCPSCGTKMKCPSCGYGHDED